MIICKFDSVLGMENLMRIPKEGQAYTEKVLKGDALKL